MIQLDNLQIFLTVARTGSLAGAATELNVSQTTVYRRLRRYEQDVGCKLFDRSESGHTLTLNGMDMFETAERVEREMLDLMRRMDGAGNSNAGRLTVTTTHSIADHVVLPTLVEFDEAYPDIVIELHCSQQRLLLEKREADVAIRPTMDPPAHLIGRKLISDTWRLCCSESYKDKHGLPAIMSDYEKHRFIFMDEMLGSYTTMQWLHDHVPSTQVAMVCNSVSAVYRAVASGLGIGLLPNWVCDNVDDNFLTIAPQAPMVQGEIWLLFHPDMRDNLHLRTFVDFIKKRLGSIEPLLSVVSK